MAMFGTAFRRIAGAVVTAVTFFGASIAAQAITYQIEDVQTGMVVGTFDTAADGTVENLAVTIAGVTYTSLASGSDGLVFDSSTGALNSTGGGFTALTNGAGSFFRIINAMVNGKIMLEWDLLTGATYESADLVAYGHYNVSAVSGPVSSVPVPAGFILLGTAMVGAGAYAARRRKTG